jgi:hypothetical protein
LHFRATERLIGVAVLLLLGTGAAAGCEKTTGGTAVRTSALRPSDPAEPVPGVEVTLPDHIPPNALTCFPSPASGRMVRASVPDPVAPVITLPLPDGWKSAPAPAMWR